MKKPFNDNYENFFTEGDVEELMDIVDRDGLEVVLGAAPFDNSWEGDGDNLPTPENMGYNTEEYLELDFDER
jgi:hypothetical protein